MNATTKNTIKAVVAGDPTVTPAMLETALAALDGKIAAKSPRKIGRLISAKEVAAAIGVTTKTVRAYAKRGLLSPIKTGAGAKRATRYDEDQVATFAARLKAGADKAEES